MFENELAINRFQLGLLEKVVHDLSEDRWFLHGAGHGHSPAWILGHLAIVAELGLSFLWGKVNHPEWIPMFGPGSKDAVVASHELSKTPLLAATLQNYRDLQSQIGSSPAEVYAKPHGIGLFEGTPIQTVGHLTALLLTNHFGFHLSQLSSCRRDLGFPALF